MKNRILICDDDVGITDMLQMLLETLDVEVYVENDSVKAFSNMMSFAPHVIVVDLWMPVLTGDQLIRQLRKSTQLQSCYILCISASRDGEDIAREAGADAFLSKPFDMDDFLEAIHKGLELYGNPTVGLGK